MIGSELIDFIYKATRLMDEEDFEDFLDLCDPGFTYTISTYSEELGKPMIWMQKDKEGFAHVLRNVNKHERYTGRLRRHVTMSRVLASEANATDIESAVAVYHTEVNGATELYAVGHYLDRAVGENGSRLLARREVVLDTRRLAFGPHVPV